MNTLVNKWPAFRQAKEKSKGTWIEKPLCDLEKDYSSEEDRKWLQEQVVDSLGPSFHFSESWEPKRFMCLELKLHPARARTAGHTTSPGLNLKTWIGSLANQPWSFKIRWYILPYISIPVISLQHRNIYIYNSLSLYVYINVHIDNACFASSFKFNLPN